MTAVAPLRITWIGHATVIIEIGKARIITDPALTASVAHLRRRRPVPSNDDVGADIVLLSHLHMDHFHRPSLRRLSASAPTIVIPAGSQSLLGTLSFPRVEQMRPGEQRCFDVAGTDLRIEAVHADHSGSRGPHSRAKAAAMGFVVRGDGRSVYFAGDTDLFDGMVDIGPVDVALIPVWGWGPTLGERHLNPRTAAQAASLLGADHVIPIHWGTYSPVRARRGSPPWLDDPRSAFRDALGDVGLADTLVELWPGESISFGK